VRLWFCAEQAYGDRLWAVATVVRRPTDPDDDAPGPGEAGGEPDDE
jgi:hypothetical protein